MGVQLREDKWTIFTMNVNLSSIAANTTANQNVAMPGLKVGDLCIQAYGAVGVAGLSFAGGVCSTPDVLSIRMTNHTAAPIDQADVPMTFVKLRPEKVDTACNFA